MLPRQASPLKKKILFGITKANWGGAQRYVFDLATHLPSDEFDAVVMAGEPGVLATRLGQTGVQFIQIPQLQRDMGLFSDISAFWSIWSTIRKERPDILHLNSPKMAGLAGLAGKLLGVPHIVMTVHGWSFLEKRGVLTKGLIVFFSWLTALLADRTIVISRGDNESAKRLPLLAESRFVLIHIGIDNNQPTLERDAAREFLQKHIAGMYPNAPKIPMKTIWIGTVSELVPNKNLPLLISAAARLPAHTLAVAIGNGEKKNELQELIQKHNAEDHIFLAGFIQDAARLLRAFDIFTLSSTKEGLPYVLLEAGLAECAVVATDISGNTDVIIDGQTGLTTPTQGSDIFHEKILSLMNDPNLRQALGQELRAHVLRNFDIQAMVEKTITVYRTISRPPHATA